MIANFKRPKKKRLLKRVYHSVFLVILATIVLGFLGFTNWKINKKRAELREEIETLEREIKILKEKNAALKRVISQAQSEQYLTKKAQEQGYFREGEKPVVVLPPKEKENEKEVLEEKSSWNPKTWWSWLKDKLKD